MANRFDSIEEKILNGEYVELDELSLTMSSLSETVAKCVNMTEDTFKFVDQLLNKNACYTHTILNDALNFKNYSLISYLANIFQNYFMNNKLNEMFYLNSDTVTKNKASDTTLFRFLMNLLSHNIELWNDVDFIKKLIEVNMLVPSDIINVILYLYPYLTNNNLIVDNNNSLANQIWNYAVKFADSEDIEKIIGILPKIKMELPLYSNLDRENTIKILENYKNYINVDDKILKKNIKKIIYNHCYSGALLFVSVSFPVFKSLLAYVNNNINFYENLLLLLFCNEGRKNKNESIDYIFELLQINQLDFLNQILCNDPKMIHKINNLNKKALKIKKYSMCDDDYEKKCTLNFMIILNYCKFKELQVNYDLIYKKITDDDWEKFYKYINCETLDYYHDFFQVLKNHNKYKRETVIFNEKIIDSYYGNELFHKCDLFRLDSEECISELIECTITPGDFKKFTCLVDAYPQVLNNVENLYNIFIEKYKNAGKKHYDYTFRMSEFLDFFEKQGINVGSDYYYILGCYIGNYSDFWLKFEELTNKYGFDINCEYAKKIFSYMCHLLDNNNTLAFIEKYKNIDHLITPEALYYAADYECSSNMINYLFNRIKQNEKIIDIHINKNYYSIDYPDHGMDILDEIRKFIKERKKNIK